MKHSKASVIYTVTIVIPDSHNFAGLFDTYSFNVAAAPFLLRVVNTMEYGCWILLLEEMVMHGDSGALFSYFITAAVLI